VKNGCPPGGWLGESGEGPGAVIRRAAYV